jgi:serine/threonine protein kinase
MIGHTLGNYRVVAKLGAGGMGEVYRATDTRLDRDVAIKVLPPTTASDAEHRARLAREARVISRLAHPNICTLLDVGQETGRTFLVMELLEGETLAQRLQKGALPIDASLRIARDILAALHAAHRQDIVHRDLKPGNIMLTPTGVKLLDFGLAKWQPRPSGDDATAQVVDATAAGTILGTLQYMAPEQLEGRPADARADLFAFGAVVYEMITGRKAFEGSTQAAVIAAILKDQPRPIAEVVPAAPAGLSRVIETCLTKSPDERWQSAADLQHALALVAEARPASPVVGGGPPGWARGAMWFVDRARPRGVSSNPARGVGDRPRGGRARVEPQRTRIRPSAAQSDRAGALVRRANARLQRSTRTPGVRERDELRRGGRPLRATAQPG